MLEKPDIQDDKIIKCLQADYGLQIRQLDFLPLGQDRSTAVYRAIANDETPYFCKLKLSRFNEISVELPRFLSDQGIAQIIPPLFTKTGKLWAEIDTFRLVLSPYVEGKAGYDLALSESNWADFGAALKRMHTTALPPTLSQKIITENYSSEWREECRSIIQRLDQGVFSDPAQAPVVSFMNAQRATMLHLIERAEQLAQILAARPAEFVLCHADIHPGNVLIDTQGTLFVVDWDRPMLSLKERDLMYIGGGQGFTAPSPDEEVRMFAVGYDPMNIDADALAYHRCDRMVTDFTVETERLLSGTMSAEDSVQSFEILKWYFKPGCAVEMAYKSDSAVINLSSE